MTAIIGESILYEAARALSGKHPLSYYQYKVLTAFAETLILHDKAILFTGEEIDEEYAHSVEALITKIEDNVDFEVHSVSTDNRSSFLNSEDIKQFELICQELYQYSLGITSDDLFVKQRKDRISEDMCERIESIFSAGSSSFETRKIADDIRSLWWSNANSSELLYFFRAHLFQAIAEMRSFTPIFENHRLIACVLQRKLRKQNRIGTLPYKVYKLVDSLFLQAYGRLPNPETYPKASILTMQLVDKITSRQAIIDAIFELREEFREFRRHYQTIEQDLINPNVSISRRAELKQVLEQSLEKVWLPVASSLGRENTPGGLKTIGKGFFGKLGIGDLKISHSEKSSTGENSISYTSPSVVGIGTALVSTIKTVYDNSQLAKPNKPLLEVLCHIVRQENVAAKLSKYLPVRDFHYRIYRLLDSALAETQNGEEQ